MQEDVGSICVDDFQRCAAPRRVGQLACCRSGRHPPVRKLGNFRHDQVLIVFFNRHSVCVSETLTFRRSGLHLPVRNLGIFLTRPGSHLFVCLAGIFFNQKLTPILCVFVSETLVTRPPIRNLGDF